MSSYNRNPETIRPLLDTYHTPPELALHVTRNFIAPRLKRAPRRIVEPHCGHGAWVAAARATWPDAHVIACDVLEDNVERGLQAGAKGGVLGDFLTLTHKHFGVAPDLVLGNPPYGRPKLDAEGNLVISKKTGKPIFEAVAHLHVAHAVDLISLRDGAAFFLLNPLILTGYERIADWDHAGDPRCCGFLSPRPSFTDGSTDSVTYTMLGWGDGIGIPETGCVTTIYWREKRARKKAS